MTQPAPDPNPPHVLLNRLNRTTAALTDRPETYDTDTLWAFLNALTDLKKAVDGELVRRMIA